MRIIPRTNILQVFPRLTNPYPPFSLYHLISDDLIKREVFVLPDPFCAVHVFKPNAPYDPPVLSFASQIARNTLNPYWHANFEFEAEEGTRYAHLCCTRSCGVRTEESDAGVLRGADHETRESGRSASLNFELGAVMQDTGEDT